jgi:acetyltransferase-like isoleucine patch superfamily enzyme
MKYSPTVSPDEQALICSPVVVEDNSAVGLNCVILPGSTLSSGSWLGAGSLLCGLVPEKVIASGVPAQVVKKRFE